MVIESNLERNNISSSNFILDQLHDIAGIRPSQEWLERCQNHLRNCDQSNAVNESPDTVLEQLLYHDLRDVIRIPPGDQSDCNQRSRYDVESISPSKELRKAIQDSFPTNGNMNNAPCKQKLTESFRLLLQIEEIVDVCCNAEARLSSGPTQQNPSIPTGNQGNRYQGNRCLKLCLSDGYYRDGNPHCGKYDDGHFHHRSMNNPSCNVTSSKSSVFVAMEVSPIKKLSRNSQAGMKLLLKGPIDIRFGVLFLHEGNSIVLGGYVQHLVDIQCKALEQAKKVAGIGVDPTIKALLWNSDALENDDPQDEGEHESGDVTISRKEQNSTTDRRIDNHNNTNNNNTNNYRSAAFRNTENNDDAHQIPGVRKRNRVTPDTERQRKNPSIEIRTPAAAADITATASYSLSSRNPYQRSISRTKNQLVGTTVPTIRIGINELSTISMRTASSDRNSISSNIASLPTVTTLDIPTQDNNTYHKAIRCEGASKNDQNNNNEQTMNADTHHDISIHDDPAFTEKETHEKQTIHFDLTCPSVEDPIFQNQINSSRRNNKDDVNNIGETDMKIINGKKNYSNSGTITLTDHQHEEQSIRVKEKILTDNNILETKVKVLSSDDLNKKISSSSSVNQKINFSNDIVSRSKRNPYFSNASRASRSQNDDLDTATIVDLTSHEALLEQEQEQQKKAQEEKCLGKNDDKIERESINLANTTEGATIPNNIDCKINNHCIDFDTNDLDSSIIKMSFDELVEILKEALQNREKYSKYYGKIFIVPVKQKGKHSHFDIEKNKVSNNKKKHDKEKVHFCVITLMIARKDLIKNESDNMNSLISLGIFFSVF